MKMAHQINNKQDFLNDCSNWCEGFQTSNKVLIAYIRRGKRPAQNIFVQSEDGTLKASRKGRRRPQGVVAAYRGDDGIVRIGWSLCRKTEAFSSKVGLRYALERAVPIGVVASRLQELEALMDLQREGVKITIPENSPPQSVRKTLTKILERTEKL